MKKLILLIGLLMVGINTLAAPSSSEIDNLVEDETLTKVGASSFLINKYTADFLNYKSVYTLETATKAPIILNFLIDCKNVRFKMLRASRDSGGELLEWRSFDLGSSMAKVAEILCPK